MNILTYDLGGSSVKYGIWNNEQLTHRGSFSTPKTWQEMKESLYTVFENASLLIDGISISTPGVVDHRKQVILGISAIPYIHHFNIFEELQQLFRLPVVIENDANCAGMAEIYQGVAKEKQEVAFVVIGTGIGGAFFHEKKLVRGAHLYGGEFGLSFLDQGKTFSELGTAVQMARRYCQRKEVPLHTYTGKDVFHFAEKGDALAQEEVNRFYDYLTQGLFGIQFSLDPEMIVLGGGVSQKEGLAEEINQRMKQKLTQLRLVDFVPNITVCQYHNDANLVGAAANFMLRTNWE